MAKPRVTGSTVPTSKTLKDFPSYLSAADKLAEVSEQLSEAERELQSARESPRETQEERIRAEAQGVLAGGPAVAALPNIGELARRRDVLAEAVRLQTIEVDNERIAAARAITAEVAPQYRAIVAEFIRLQLAANAEYDKLIAMKAATTQACQGPSLLADVAIPPQQLDQFRYRFGVFKSSAESMLDLPVNQ